MWESVRQSRAIFSLDAGERIGHSKRRRTDSGDPIESNAPRETKAPAAARDLGASLFGVVYLAIGAWHIRWLSRREVESAMQFRQAVALSVVPILVAWFLNSTLFQIYADMASGARLRALDDSSWIARREARGDRLAVSETTAAVTLSGGGYRAAAVHAGILWTLDQAGYPVDVLSTVSGGSIVGASYAMGMSAADFRDHLKNAKPGLPNDLMNFYPVFAQLFVPGYGSGDTYANHFDRVFFQRRTLEQTGPPLLIVNTTRYRDGTRRAFRAETDGQLLLGRVVAASGAFPVAFDPVPIEGEFYIDGGVVENLGIAGLQNHLESHATDASLGDLIPQVLIISDAGLIPEAPPVGPSPRYYRWRRGRRILGWRATRGILSAGTVQRGRHQLPAGAARRRAASPELIGDLGNRFVDRRRGRWRRPYMLIEKSKDADQHVDPVRPALDFVVCIRVLDELNVFFGSLEYIHQRDGIAGHIEVCIVLAMEHQDRCVDLTGTLDGRRCVEKIATGSGNAVPNDIGAGHQPRIRYTRDADYASVKIRILDRRH
jgi:hypothetical protein